MVLPQGVFKLKGVVHHYTWGGHDFIPELLNIGNSSKLPYAEYWLGAHPAYPAQVVGHPITSLSEWITRDPVHVLGGTTAKKFGSLPYLLKIMDVRQMLSIQVHPSKEMAVKGYEEEDKKSVPLQAPNRNYKDRNHKPEMLVALGDFWLLHGFKKQTLLQMVFEATPELSFLKDIFDEKGYKAIYEEVMLMDQERVNKILRPLVERILPLYEEGSLSKNEEDFWAARAASLYCRNGVFDRGIFSIYLFNLVFLKRGEGVFQGVGLPHAYLEGRNVEVMSNSDNVLRAGLTDKHIDVPELLKHVLYVPTEPDIFRIANTASHHIFSVPADEFELHEYEMSEGEEQTIISVTAETWIVLEGVVDIRKDKSLLTVSKGEAFFVTAGSTIQLKSKASSSLFRVTVPEV